MDRIIDFAHVVSCNAHTMRLMRRDASLSDHLWATRTFANLMTDLHGPYISGLISERGTWTGNEMRGTYSGPSTRYATLSKTTKK